MMVWLLISLKKLYPVHSTAMKRMRQTALALLFTVTMLILAWCLHISAEEPQIAPVRHHSIWRERTDIEQYPIYSVVLEHYVTNKTKLLVIRNETSKDLSEEYRGDDANDDLVKILRSIAPQDTIDDYTFQNGESAVLQDLFALSVRCRLIDARKLSGDGLDWWSTFQKLYPLASGVMTLSRIGFSEDLNQALVYVEYNCGFLCATGVYFSLEQKDGAWRIIKEHMRWIS
jgi:hypothetical protein